MDFSFLNQLQNVKLLIAGEVGIDEYIWGDCHRLSPEAPVPILEVESRDFRLGLAGNVGHNVASLGGRVSLVTVTGQDEDSKRLHDLIGSAGISQCRVTEDVSRPTLRKTRVIARKQHLVRVDYEKSHPLDAKLAKQFTEQICDLIPQNDGVIVQDYGKGIWNADTMVFVKQAKVHGKPIFVDPSRLSPLTLYQGATLLTPNLAEAASLCGIPHESGQNEARLLKMALQILDTTDAEHAIVTCGQSGMVSVSRGSRELTRIPTYAREVFDVTGAGDTVIAVLGMLSVLDLPIRVGMQIANAAAGLVVGRIGASSVTVQELKQELERLAGVGLLRSDS